MKPNVFITGVSSGIGHGLAAEYLRRGFHVYGVSRRQPDDLVDTDGFHFRALDLRDEQAIETTVSDLLHGVTHLQTVVLNAGILGEIADLRDTSLIRLRELMDVNVWSCKLTLDVLTSICPKIERVISISSGAAVNGNRGWNGYAISKAALNMLTQLYAAENKNIHFAAIAPGLVDTAMQDYLCRHNEDTRFPSLEVLKSKRRTVEMPPPNQVAQKLIAIFDSIEKVVPSGGFVDIRQLPEFDAKEKI